MKTNDPLIEHLNEQQVIAVTAPPGNLLVLAGAGSGKTRVLVHRIAWLIENERVSPNAILAVTFTNKAASEMRSRIEALSGMPLASMWVGTFHGLAHRLLRQHWEAAKLPQSFQILDADDQQRLIKRIHRHLNLDEDKWQPKQSQSFINKQKEEGRRAKDINEDGSYYIETMLTVYRAYEEICERSGLVDFSELLLRSLELLRENIEIADHYQNRFQHVLVDEFQDTNTIQYLWLQMIGGKNTCVMAVGDDDQSIYSWRGARIENIHRFSKDHKNTQTIRLEQNYRSTQTILNAANAIIEHNRDRLGKTLWCDGSIGEPITLYMAYNEKDEAYYITSIIKHWAKQFGHSYHDIAVLYRSNAQSRILEEQLIESRIAYRIYGGQKFFERAEIKDALAYLRLIANRHDDAAFERVVNLPTRGIGNTTLKLLRDTARENAASLWQTAEFLYQQQTLSSRASNALQNFLHLIQLIDKETTDSRLGEQCEHMLHRSGLLAHYRNDKSEKGLSRVENLEELINAMSQFKSSEQDIQLSPLATFLSHVALETGESQADPHADAVSLMTLHAAKGLEFPVVIIAGMEEDLFPHHMSMDQGRGLEEERRLCYVGMTRARQKLYLTYCEMRRLYGREKINHPSRFLSEIPEQFLDRVRPSAKVSRPSYYRDGPADVGYPNYAINKSVSKDKAIGNTGLQLGQQVKHKKFGTGIIVNHEGRGQNTRVQVKFERAGLKWLVAQFAGLES